VLLTVLCVDIMRGSDVFEAYYLFTFSDIHNGNN